MYVFSVLFLVLSFIFNLFKFYVTGDSYFLRVICLHIYLVLIASLYARFPYHTQSDSVLLWLFLDFYVHIAQRKIYFCAWSALSLLEVLAFKFDRFATMQ